jgi:diguanylate cyclase (GGDEF)-like protein
MDYRNVPSQHGSIIQARNSQNIYLAGPVNLVQGGKGLIARYPIFSDFPENLQYWGVVSVVIDYTKLLDSLDLPGISGADIAIRRTSRLNASAPYSAFYGNDGIFEQADYSVLLTLPGATWEVAAKYNINQLVNITRIENVIRGLGWSLGIVLLTSIVLFFRYLHYTRIASLQDELTRLPNRRFAMMQLQQLMQVYKEQRSFAILNIDVNEFKSINDTYGHHVGDQYLQHIANILKHSVRASDPVSRMGGDEFIVILHRAESSDTVAQTINKIENALTRAKFIVNKSKLIPSVSVGYAMANEHTTTTELLKAADANMYQNKFHEKQKKKVTYVDAHTPLEN